jgi:hypothetical protein
MAICPDHFLQACKSYNQGNAIESFLPITQSIFKTLQILDIHFIALKS